MALLAGGSFLWPCKNLQNLVSIKIKGRSPCLPSCSTNHVLLLPASARIYTCLPHLWLRPASGKVWWFGQDFQLLKSPQPISCCCRWAVALLCVCKPGAQCGAGALQPVRSGLADPAGGGLCSTCTTFGQSVCRRPRLLFKPPICTTWAGQHKPHTSQTQWTYYAYVNAEGLCMFLSGKSQSSSTWKANMLERRLTVYMCIHI